MDFIKGTILGIVTGMVLGAMNSDSVYKAIRMGKKQYKRFKRKYT
ncbi:MAG: hypothetical protein RSE41_06735 [Clostridia bacterium]